MMSRTFNESRSVKMTDFDDQLYKVDRLSLLSLIFSYIRLTGNMKSDHFPIVT